MSDHNICFCPDIRKIIQNYLKRNHPISGSMGSQLDNLIKSNIQPINSQVVYI